MPLSTPQNLEFSRVPGPVFLGFGHPATPPSEHFWVGLAAPKIMVFQTHPGALEIRIMASPALFLVPPLGLLRGPS